MIHRIEYKRKRLYSEKHLRSAYLTDTEEKQEKD